jgi:hypothetical protein
VISEEFILTVSFRIFSLAVSFQMKIMNIQRLFNMKPMLLQLVNQGNCKFLGFHIRAVDPSHSSAGLDSPLGLKEVGAPRISRLSTHESGKVFSPAHQLPSHPNRIR